MKKWIRLIHCHDCCVQSKGHTQPPGGALQNSKKKPSQYILSLIKPLVSLLTSYFCFFHCVLSVKSRRREGEQRVSENRCRTAALWSVPRCNHGTHHVIIIKHGDTRAPVAQLARTRVFIHVETQIHHNMDVSNTLNIQINRQLKEWMYTTFSLWENVLVRDIFSDFIR